MATDQMHKIQIEITTSTRKRLELVKAIIAMGRHDLGNVTWANCVEWLTQVMPLGAMLQDAVKGTDLVTDVPPEPDQDEGNVAGKPGSKRNRSDITQEG